MPDDNEPLPAALTAVVAELRREVPLRDAWHEQLQRELAAADRSAVEGSAADLADRRVAGAARVRSTRAWRITPVSALAAALVCMVAGAMLGDLARAPVSPERERPPATLATLPAAAAAEPAGPMAVRFAVMAPGVQRVSVVGDFNGWDADATPLTLASDGRTWTTLLPLSAGRHTYAFVIDGQIVRDPIAPADAEEDFGVPNSVLLVSSRK